MSKKWLAIILSICLISGHVLVTAAQEAAPVDEASAAEEPDIPGEEVTASEEAYVEEADAEEAAAEDELPSESGLLPEDELLSGEELTAEDELLPEDELFIEDDLLPEDEMTTQGDGPLADGTCGDGVYWYLDQSGKMDITGTGNIKDCKHDGSPDPSKQPWAMYRDQIDEVFITDGVTGIGMAAFANCSNLVRVSIPASVTSLGKEAFRDCKHLVSVGLPSVTTIPAACFCDCTHLEDFSAPKLKAIHEGAFFDCISLETVILPDTLITMRTGVFWNCSNLTEVRIPSGVTTIPQMAFYNCENLSKIEIPNSVTTIKEEAFAGCSSLREIKAAGCYIIEQEAFHNCTDLLWAEFALKRPSTSVYPKIGASAFENCVNLVEFYCADGLECIEYNAFYNASSLERISIPATVTLIATSAFEKANIISDVEYRGTKSQRQNTLMVDPENDTLTGAVWHYKGEKKTVKISEKSIEITGKNATSLYAFIEPSASYQSIRWKSSNPAVATVSNDGVVRGVFYGKTTVTAMTPDGSSKATCQVNVWFGDVPPGHVRFAPVTWGADKKITNGYKDTNTFGVDNPCTRGHFVMFLWKYAGKPAPKQVSKAYFKDVPVGHTYFKPVQWAYEKGITKGVSATEFGVNQACTRAQAMTFLWRYKGQPAPKGKTYPFVDSSLPNATQQKAIMWGAEQKITGGTDNGNGTKSFRPFDTCSRGHIMHFLYKMDRLK